MKVALKIRKKVMEVERKTGARTLGWEGGVSWRVRGREKASMARNSKGSRTFWKQGAGGSQPRMDL